MNFFTSHLHPILFAIPLFPVVMMQSILINGVGQHNCSLATPLSNGGMGTCDTRLREGQCKANVISVLPNKIYRLRVASATSLSALNLQIKVSSGPSEVITSNMLDSIL